MRQKYWDDCREGDEIPSIDKIATTQTLVKWAGATGDFIPLHFDQDFALAKGMKGIIVHGSLKRQWLVHLMTDFAGEEGFLKKFWCNYRSIDYPRKMKSFDTPYDGETWHCRGKIIKKYQDHDEFLIECDIWIEKETGEQTTTGKAIVSLPRRM